MTDPTHPNDEAVSSYLDGEATLDEVARIEADPELLARAQELGAVTELMSTPVEPLPQHDVDRLIDNALDQGAGSSRTTDLAAVRAKRRFNPRRLATVAAALIILAGAVGALIVFNSDGGEDTFASSTDDSSTADSAFAEDSDDTASNSDAALESDTADSDTGMAESDVMSDEGEGMVDEGPAEEYAGPDAAPGDMSDAEESADRTRRDESDRNGDTESGFGDAAAEATTTPPHIPGFEIADSYPTFSELIDQATDRWKELTAAGATHDPDAVIEPGTAEQALAELPCGQTYIDAFDRSGWGDIINVSTTTVAGAPVTVVVQTSVDDAELLVAAEPACTVTLLATLTP